MKTEKTVNDDTTSYRRQTNRLSTEQGGHSNQEKN